MKYTLSKISREYNAKISDVVKFLVDNGYEIEEDPRETITHEILQFIKFNFPAYLSDKRLKSEVIKSAKVAVKEKEELIVREDLPIEIRIIESVSKEKKLVERIIGFTDFEWQYLVTKYKGECSQPVQFDIFDDVICELLKIDSLSMEEIGNILGLDVKNDPAESEILEQAINSLKKDKMVEGDESVLWLTDLGNEYATNGVKFSTFKRDFELYSDIIDPEFKNAKKVFSNVKSEKKTELLPDVHDLSYEEIQNIAEIQAPEVHFPQNNYKLLSAEKNSSVGYVAKLWVCLLENFRDNTTRALVYDEVQDTIIDELSKILDKNEEMKNDLLEKLILVDEELQETDETKPEEQSEKEESLIKIQDELDKALVEGKTEEIKEIIQKTEATKNHFNTLEFEVELKRIFDETKGSLWILSPWVKDNAFFKRIPFIEKYLRKGGEVYIAFSQPESSNDEMVQEKSMNKLEELDTSYNNFYYCELPPFHYKNVYLLEIDSKPLYYTGSYNILSFFVHQNQKYIRQEKMTRSEWNNEIGEEYLTLFKQFGVKYINKAIETLNNLCQNPPETITKEYIQKIGSVDYSKIKPFISSDIEEFEKSFEEIENTRNENLSYYKKKFFEKEIRRFELQLEEIKSNPISYRHKSNLLEELRQLRDKNMEFIELQFKASALQEEYEKIKPLKGNKPGHSNFKKRKR